jgi:agmatine/peptidylarginine deiminase
LKIEKYSHEAIEAGFADQLASGNLSWMMKNLDEETNAHFIDDYKLFTKALVLVRYENGQQVKWKNCDKVWELLNDEAEFKKYVEAQVAEFLGS